MRQALVIGFLIVVAALLDMELLATGLVVWLVIVIVRKFRRGDMRMQVPAKWSWPLPVVSKHRWKPHWETDDPAPKTGQQPNLEHEILKVAQARRGIVTPADVSIATTCNLETAKLMLDRLVQQGHAELRATRNGDLVYVVPSLLNKTLPEDLEPLV